MCWGAGCPYVKVHDNPFDRRLWMCQTVRLARGFKVINVDIGATATPIKQSGRPQHPLRI